jgi:hypothetical protein
MSRATTLAFAFAILTCVTGRARAQDFSAPADVDGPLSAAAGGLLEQGLPALRPGPSLELAAVRWFGLAELTTRWVAAEAGWRALRAGAGLSQTGDPDLGWTALGAALGIADSSGGAAVRAVARRDRTSRFGFDAEGAAVGVEIGGGAWVQVTPALTLWASAPQLWTRGAAPPQVRALEMGGVARVGTLAIWLARAAVPGWPRGGRGEHAGGVATSLRPVAIALTARDQPLRGGVSVAARAPRVTAIAGVESHPVLGETLRLALAIGGGR